MHAYEKRVAERGSKREGVGKEGEQETLFDVVLRAAICVLRFCRSYELAYAKFFIFFTCLKIK